MDPCYEICVFGWRKRYPKSNDVKDSKTEYWKIDAYLVNDISEYLVDCATAKECAIRQT